VYKPKVFLDFFEGFEGFAKRNLRFEELNRGKTFDLCLEKKQKKNKQPRR